MHKKIFSILSLIVLLSSLAYVKSNLVEAKAVRIADDLNHTILKEVTSETHDIAIDNVSLSLYKAGAGREIDIEVIVRNEGDFTEAFNVTIHANSTSESIFLDSYLVSSLGSLDQISIPFIWDTAKASTGNYTVNAEADVVEGETDTADNAKNSSIVSIRADNTAPVIVFR